MISQRLCLRHQSGISTASVCDVSWVTAACVTAAGLLTRATTWRTCIASGTTLRVLKVQSDGHAASLWATCLCDFSSVSRRSAPWQVSVTGVRWCCVYQRHWGRGRRRTCDFFNCTAELRQFVCIPGGCVMWLYENFYNLVHQLYNVNKQHSAQKTIRFYLKEVNSHKTCTRYSCVSNTVWLCYLHSN